MVVTNGANSCRIKYFSVTFRYKKWQNFVENILRRNFGQITYFVEFNARLYFVSA